MLKLLLHKHKPLLAFTFQLSTDKPPIYITLINLIDHLTADLIIFNERTLILPLVFAEVKNMWCPICWIYNQYLLDISLAVALRNELDICYSCYSVSSEKWILQANEFLAS